MGAAGGRRSLGAACEPRTCGHGGLPPIAAPIAYGVVRTPSAPIPSWRPRRA